MPYDGRPRPSNLNGRGRPLYVSLLSALDRLHAASFSVGVNNPCNLPIERVRLRIGYPSISRMLHDIPVLVRTIIAIDSFADAVARFFIDADGRVIVGIHSQ